MGSLAGAPRRSPSTTGFVVAGGRSRRMGRDKALLPWSEGTLLDHALRRLRAVTDDVRVLCGPELRYVDLAVPLVTDSFPESGPLVAVASGLLAANRPLALALAVDLPRVPVELLGALVEMADGFDVVVPMLPAGPEPLCAVYRHTCLAPAEAAIARADFKMTSFWPEVRVRHVGPDQLAAFGDPETLFANVNAPPDYQRALSPRL